MYVLGVFGCIWVYLGVFGCMWVYVGVFGCIWMYLGIFRYMFGYNWVHSTTSVYVLTKIFWYFLVYHLFVCMNISIKVWPLIGLEQDMFTSYWLTEAKLPQ